MNALTVGALILLYLLLSNSATAFIISETTPDFQPGNCETIVRNGENFTECDSDGPTFVDTMLEVSVGEIPGTPEWFDGFWLGLNVFLLVLGIVNILAFFIGLIFGGAS